MASHQVSSYWEKYTALVTGSPFIPLLTEFLLVRNSEEIDSISESMEVGSDEDESESL